MPAVTPNDPSAPAFSAPRPRHGGRIWTGRVLTTLATLFLLFDAYGKLARQPQVIEAFARMGFSAAFSVELGTILLVCTVLYAVPRTTALGALFLTGYLGGAVALQWRAANPPFEIMFPVLFAVLMWAGVFLRECRLWSVIPVRRAR